MDFGTLENIRNTIGESIGTFCSSFGLGVRQMAVSPHNIWSYHSLEPPLFCKDQSLHTDKLPNCHGMLKTGGDVQISLLLGRT